MDTPTKPRPGWYAMTPWLRLPAAYLVGMTIPIANLLLVVHVAMARGQVGLPPPPYHPIVYGMGTLFLMGVTVAALSGGHWVRHGFVVVGLVMVVFQLMAWRGRLPGPNSLLYHLGTVALGLFIGLLPAQAAFGGAALGGWIAKGLGSDRPLAQPSSEPEAQG